MGSNSFGQIFKWTTFGESHGSAMGVVIDGCPSGLEVNEELLLVKLQRRKPGQKGTTARRESDIPEILSGVYQGKTLGTPIAVAVKNGDQKFQDYDSIKNQPRVGHADDMWAGKFGHWDPRGGGRASARETINWVIAGAFAEMLCRQFESEVEIESKLIQVGGVDVEGNKDPQLLARLEQARTEGESFGALVQLKIKNSPAYLGEPIFLKAKSEFCRAFTLINACTGVELGDGFELAKKRGTEVHLQPQSPVYGGIRGGVTTGEDILFRLAFKPTASILDTAKQGRHDPCVAIRALPVVEAMAWNVLADLLLARKLNQI